MRLSINQQSLRQTLSATTVWLDRLSTSAVKLAGRGLRQTISPLREFSGPRNALMLLSLFSQSYLHVRPSWHRRMVALMAQEDARGMPKADVISAAIAKAGMENQILWVVGLAGIRSSPAYGQWYPVVIGGLLHSKLIHEQGLLSVVSVIPADSMASSLNTLETMLKLAMAQQHSLASLQTVIDSFWNTHPSTIFEKMAGFLPKLRTGQSAASYRQDVTDLCVLIESNSATRH